MITLLERWKSKNFADEMILREMHFILTATQNGEDFFTCDESGNKIKYCVPYKKDLAQGQKTGICYSEEVALSAIKYVLTEYAYMLLSWFRQGDDEITFSLKLKEPIAYADYVMTIKERDKEHRTVHRYRDLLKRINEQIGHIRLDKLTCEHLNKFYFKLEEPGVNKRTGGALSPKTIREHHRLIHVILAQAQKEGILKRNVADMASPPSVPDNEVEVIQLDEMRKVIELLDTEPLIWKTITNVMLATGARRGEVMGLHWRNVDFDTSVIKIVDNMQYTPERGVYITTTKSKKSRTVKVPQYVVDLLKELKMEQDKMKKILGDDWYDTGLCFVGDYGRRMHPDSITQWLKKFCKKHDIKHIHPHKFRHSILSLLVNQNVDVATVSGMAGHKHISTTENIYVHQMNTGIDIASSVVDRTLYDGLKK